MTTHFDGMILLIELDKEPCHGYELRKRIKAITDNLVNIGFIYPVLYEYEKIGLIKSHHEKNWRGQTIRVYELTDEGRRQARLIKLMLAKLLSRVPEPTSESHTFWEI